MKSLNSIIIQTRGKFHQHFMHMIFIRKSLLAAFLCLESGLEQTFVQKTCAYKMLMKLTEEVLVEILNIDGHSRLPSLF